MITRQLFGHLPDGREVHLFHLNNKRGVQAAITNFGGIVVKLLVPGKDGKLDDVVLGFDNLEPYLKDHPYFGCIVGRFANRIDKGLFTLDGQTYQLEQNNHPNGLGCHLHGGKNGFDKQLWHAQVKDDDEPKLILNYQSKNGEANYPGNLKVTVTYVLTNNNGLEIRYHATTDKATIINLTNHSYFNLKGGQYGDIKDHLLQIEAEYYTPTTEGLIPNGEITPVANTVLDFRRQRTIGSGLNSADPLVNLCNGYDHNLVLNKGQSDEHKLSHALSHTAKVVEPRSGRQMDLWTTEPGVQFYTGNFLDGRYRGKGGRYYQNHDGFCLETQHFPDSPNQQNFPSTVLRPGEHYESTTRYEFSLL